MLPKLKRKSLENPYRPTCPQRMERPLLPGGGWEHRGCATTASITVTKVASPCGTAAEELGASLFPSEKAMQVQKDLPFPGIVCNSFFKKIDIVLEQF